MSLLEESDAKEPRSKLSVGLQVFGIALSLGAAALTIGSHYISDWRTCSETRVRHTEETDESDRIERTCDPVNLADVAPVLLLGLLLAVPGWTELSVGVVGIKRELRKALQQQEDLKQKIELRILVDQISTQPDETVGVVAVTPAEDPRGREVVGAIQSILTEIRAKAKEAGAPVSLQRQLSSLEHVIELANRHPDSVSVQELEKVLERAKALAAAS